MILHKETYKKYGYWPKDLAEQSDKRILLKCSVCNKVYDRMKHNFTNRRSEFYTCAKCVHKIIGKHSGLIEQNKRKGIINGFFKKYKKIKPATQEELIDLYDNCCVTVKNTYSVVLYKQKRKTVEESIKMFCSLGMTSRPLSTSDFKLKILLLMEKHTMFNYINRIMNSNAGCVYKTSIWLKQHRKLIPVLNNFPDIKWEKRGKHIRITRGSFFINGKWIDIGQQDDDLGECPGEIDFSKFDQPNIQGIGE